MQNILEMLQNIENSQTEIIEFLENNNTSLNNIKKRHDNLCTALTALDTVTTNLKLNRSTM